MNKEIIFIVITSILIVFILIEGFILKHQFKMEYNRKLGNHIKNFDKKVEEIKEDYKNRILTANEKFNMKLDTFLREKEELIKLNEELKEKNKALQKKNEIKYKRIKSGIVVEIKEGVFVKGLHENDIGVTHNILDAKKFSITEYYDFFHIFRKLNAKIYEVEYELIPFKNGITLTKNGLVFSKSISEEKEEKKI